MILNRRGLLTGLGTLAAIRCAAARTTPPLISTLGLDAAHFGVRAGSPDDQTAALQKAIDQAADARVPLALAPGIYRATNLLLPPGAQIVGVRGATRLLATEGRPIFISPHSDAVTLSALTLDGAAIPLPPRLGLLTLMHGHGVTIEDCTISRSGGHGIWLEAVGGQITGTVVRGAADVAIISYDAKGLVIANNAVREAGNNGIQILRHVAGEDGTMIVDNTIEDIRNRSGGSGEFGNGINAHRAAHVIVRGNRIRHCAFSAVRGNAASFIQIVGNACSELGEVALYSEFGFEGAIIAHNTVDGAETGVSVANFNEGGRIAVVQGNIFRNLSPRQGRGQPESTRGIGIYVEADTAVTGNVVEGASLAGIMVGWGRFLRDVAVTGNVLRATDIGIAVSAVPGAGQAVIAHNIISGCKRGAILGMDHLAPVTGDLAKEGAIHPAHLAISGNRVN